jgi:hypothetical protein
MAVLVAACGPTASRSTPQASCGRPFSPRIQRGLRGIALVVRRTYHIPGIAVG